MKSRKSTNPHNDKNHEPAASPNDSLPTVNGPKEPLTGEPCDSSQIEQTSQPQPPICEANDDLESLRVSRKIETHSRLNLEKLAPASPLNINDLAALRVEEPGADDSVPVAGVPKIGKPGKQTWFRTKGNESQWFCYYTFIPEDDLGKTIYLVSPDVASLLGPLVSQKRLVPYITLEGDIHFWPLAVPDQPNTWSESALIIAGDATTEWRRMAADMKAKKFKAWRPRIPKPDPIWPDDAVINALLVSAADGKVIDSTDHPEVLKLF